MVNVVGIQRQGKRQFQDCQAQVEMSGLSSGRLDV